MPSIRYVSPKVVLTANITGHDVEFKRWEGDCSGTDLSTSVTMNNDKKCTANISAIAVHELTVDKIGDEGTGRVTSYPLGIDCGEECSQKFETNTFVSLHAHDTPEIKFKGWSDDCTGESATTEVVINESKKCTAIFEKTDE